MADRQRSAACQCLPSQFFGFETKHVLWQRCVRARGDVNSWRRTVGVGGIDGGEP